jgi:hypothetical protein
MAVGVLVWMLLPAATERGNVVLIGDTSSSALFPEMITHIRDNGRQATPAVVTPSPCDIADELAVVDIPAGVDFAVIIIGPDDCSDDPIEDALAVARDRGLEPVVVRLPETDRRDLDAIVVDTEVLLGEPDVRSQPCEWWDPVGPFFSGERSPCGADGLVVVRFPDGSLTEDGIQRVARMTSAAIG